MQRYLITADPDVQIHVREWAKQRGIRILYQHAFKSEWQSAFSVVSFLTEEDELRWGRAFAEWVEEAPIRMYRKFFTGFGRSPYSTIPDVPLDSEIVLG